MRSWLALLAVTGALAVPTTPRTLDERGLTGDCSTRIIQQKANPLCKQSCGPNFTPQYGAYRFLSSLTLPLTSSRRQMDRASARPPSRRTALRAAPSARTGSSSFRSSLLGPIADFPFPFHQLFSEPGLDTVHLRAPQVHLARRQDLQQQLPRWTVWRRQQPVHAVLRQRQDLQGRQHRLDLVSSLAPPP